MANPRPKPPARETLEESGYTVRPVRLLAAYDRDRHGHPPIPYHVYRLVFLCEILDEPPSSDVDTDGRVNTPDRPDA